MHKSYNTLRRWMSGLKCFWCILRKRSHVCWLFLCVS